MAHSGAALSLLVFVAGCNGKADNPPEGSTSAVGGSGGGTSASDGGSAGAPGVGGTGGSAGVGGTGGSAGVGGTGGASAGAAGAAGAGDEPPVCEPSIEWPLDNCEYPESLGGAGDPSQCGVTPAAWYPLGDSDLTTWPERAGWRSASGGGLTGSLGLRSIPEVAFDPEGRLVLGWLDDGLQLRRWSGSGWDVLPSEPLAPSGLRSFAMVLDQAGNPVVLERYADTSRVIRWGDDGWVSLAEWPASGRPGRIALDGEDQPVVVYKDFSRREDEAGMLLAADCRIVAKRWNGASFEELPGTAAADSLHECEDSDTQQELAQELALELAVRENGDVVVAWIEQLDRTGYPYEPAAIWLKQWSGDGWEELGGSATEGGVSSAVRSSTLSAFTLAVDSDDQIMVAWDGPDGSMRQWDGTTWLAPEDYLDEPRLYQGPAGSVYRSRIVDGIVFERWDAGTWVSLPAPSLPGWDFELAAGYDEQLALVWLDPASYSDDLYLSVNTDGQWRELGEATAQGEGLDFVDPQGLTAIGNDWFLHSYYCRGSRWDGQTWRDLDLSDWVGPLGVCGGSTLTESPTGQPVLGLWLHGEPEAPDDLYEWAPDLYLLGWTGEGWEQLAEPYHHDTWVAAPTIAFDSSGAPFVAWTDLDYGDYATGVHVIVWNGTEWESVLDADASQYSSGIRLLALPDDRMLVSWPYERAGSIYEDGQWTDLPELPAGRLELVVDAEGKLFAHGLAEADLVLFEFSESGWRPVPADEAHLSRLPESIRWQLFSDGGEIYVRRFEDCGWRGLSASDRGGGVSNSEATSRSPSLALHDGTTCVSWVERAEYEEVQLVRCHD